MFLIRVILRYKVSNTAPQAALSTSLREVLLDQNVGDAYLAAQLECDHIRCIYT